MPNPSYRNLAIVFVVILTAASVGYASLTIWRDDRGLETHQEEPNTSTVEYLPRQNETSSKSATVRFSGEVLRGQTFEKEIVQGLVFRLIPGVPASDDGWTISIGTQKSLLDDFSRVVTPPYRGVINDLEIEGWQFRNADNSGPNDGSVNAPQEIREFYFVLNEEDAEEASNLLSTILWSSEVEQVELEDNLAKYEAIPKGKGKLTIKDMKLGNLEAGEKAWIQSLRFDLELKMDKSEVVDNMDTNQTHGEVDVSDWTTYQNKMYGFTLKYPNDWHAYDENTWNADSVSLRCDQSYSISNTLILSRENLGSCVGVLLWDSWPGDFVIRLMDDKPTGFPYLLGTNNNYEIIEVSGAFGVKYPFTRNSELPRKRSTRVYMNYEDRAYIVEFVQTDKEGNYDAIFDSILESISF